MDTATVPVLLFGGACIVAGLVGGGLKLGGSEFPVIRSRGVRFTLTSIGVLFLLIGMGLGAPGGPGVETAGATDRSSSATPTPTTPTTPTPSPTTTVVTPATTTPAPPPTTRVDPVRAYREAASAICREHLSEEALAVTDPADFAGRLVAMGEALVEVEPPVSLSSAHAAMLNQLVAVVQAYNSYAFNLEQGNTYADQVFLEDFRTNTPLYNYQARQLSLPACVIG